jgi:hypothetical protein
MSRNQHDWIASLARSLLKCFYVHDLDRAEGTKPMPNLVCGWNCMDTIESYVHKDLEGTLTTDRSLMTLLLQLKRMGWTAASTQSYC